ncbi:MAG: hypothetical protein PHY16_02555 [Methylobacter sp.]|nr:hypothetical protein [Methylobacter sp.]
MASDNFALCSDGLDKDLTHTEIATYCIMKGAGDIAQSLVREAENRRGRDNISVIVVTT